MKMLFQIATYLTVGILMMASACHSPQSSLDPKAPLLQGLGDHTLDITTDSTLAETYFNQGFNLTYGFNHDEAERSYREAVRQDSTCAMCYWGVAQVLGSNYNVAMSDDVKQEASRMIKLAQQYAEDVSDWERGLIEATALRYNYDKSDEQPVLDADYAEALRQLHEQLPEHIDIAALYAEALMILHPWDLYTRDGQPKAWTPQITALLEEILKKAPDHAGAHHLYIHAVEASAKPEVGLASADKLGSLMPGAGHIVHMPSHIYIRTGKYHEGSVVNEKAIEVDSLYLDACASQGVYPLMLFPHNIHFLAATAAFEGRGETSINAAYRVAAHTDTTVIREEGWQTLQHYLMIPHYVLVKFAQWDHILTLEQPDEDLLYPNAVWQYARGMAFAGKGQLTKARQALAEVKKTGQNPALAEITIWDLNSAVQLVQIAERVLEAEILRKEGKRKEAITLLKEAVEIEDQLNYNEPPDWFFSVRHPLGAVLLEDGQYAEAEKVFLEDLFFLPENGWALNGLYQSLSKQNKQNEAAEVKKRFEEAWQYADIALESSEVKAMAYQNISGEAPFGSYLASIQQFAMCGKSN
ncbi:hypothetical protein WJR50_06280 [Catalinimonas sp. 4WD22]|uniref:hypothetical protein n=1 Tax=Catalinimonas locisalis TaxID=3133978 RepID=UPI0031019F54